MHLDNLKGVCASVVNNHSHDFNFAKNRQRNSFHDSPNDCANRSTQHSH